MGKGYSRSTPLVLNVGEVKRQPERSMNSNKKKKFRWSGPVKENRIWWEAASQNWLHLSCQVKCSSEDLGSDQFLKSHYCTLKRERFKHFWAQSILANVEIVLAKSNFYAYLKSPFSLRANVSTVRNQTQKGKMTEDTRWKWKATHIPDCDHRRPMRDRLTFLHGSGHSNDEIKIFNDWR